MPAENQWVGEVNAYPNPITVLTIGQIRDFATNKTLLGELGNNKDFFMLFAGKSLIASRLEQHSRDSSISNVSFSGYYDKVVEDSIVEKCDIINVCMGDNVNSNCLMSNRIYLAARLRRPLLSFEGSYQAEVIKKCGLGLVISRNADVAQEIKNYLEQLDTKVFNDSCELFLEDVAAEIKVFDESLNQFVDKIRPVV